MTNTLFYKFPSLGTALINLTKAQNYFLLKQHKQYASGHLMSCTKLHKPWILIQIAVIVEMLVMCRCMKGNAYFLIVNTKNIRQYIAYIRFS